MINNCECCLLPIKIIVTRHLLEGDLEFTMDWDRCQQNSQVEGAQVQFIIKYLIFVKVEETGTSVGVLVLGYSHHSCMGIVPVFYANFICYVIWF